MIEKTDTEADRRWLEANPAKPVYYLPAVDTIADLPKDPEPWNAVWIRENWELLVFAFDRWLDPLEMVRTVKTLGGYTDAIL
jgi:hypothetical protein